MGKKTNTKKTNTKQGGGRRGNWVNPPRKGKIAVDVATDLGKFAVKELSKPALQKAGQLILKAINHPQWYTNTSVSNLVGANFARRKGTFDRALAPISTQAVEEGKNVNLSTVHAVGLPMYDTVPRSNSGDDGWRQGIMELFASIRAANSGLTNYTIYDVERYVYSVAQLHSLWATGHRAILALNSASYYDAQTPRAWFRAMGLSYDGFSDNAANFCTFMQLFTNILSSSVPLKCDYIERKRWLYGSAFYDSNDAKATPIFPVYAKAPILNYISDDPYFREEDGGSTLQDTTFARFGNSTSSATFGVTYGAFITNVRLAIDRFRNNDVYAIIAGDIMKAYGADAFYTGYDYSSINDALIPIYDEYLLSQFQNATVRGNTEITTSSPVPADADVWFTDVFNTAGTNTTRTSMSAVAFAKGRPINWNRNDINPGELLSITRLTCAAPNTMTATPEVLWHGGEIPMYLEYICSADDKSLWSVYDASGLTAFESFIDQKSDAYAVSQLIPTFWSQVDYAPYTLYNFTEEDSEDTIYLPLFDVNNYAIIDDSTLCAYNNAAVYSMLQTDKRLRVNQTELFNTVK